MQQEKGGLQNIALNDKKVSENNLSVKFYLPLQC